MQRRPAELACALVDPRPDRRVRGGSAASPLRNARKYSIVPPTSSGTRPRARISAISAHGIARETLRRSTLRRDRGCRSGDAATRGALGERRLRRADVHAAIDHGGVDADDLEREARARDRARARSCPRPSAPSAGRQPAWSRAGGHRPRRNSRSSSSMPMNDQVGRPWMHWSLRTVRFHLAQQRIHLAQLEAAMGAHRACGRPSCRDTLLQRRSVRRRRRARRGRATTSRNSAAASAFASSAGNARTVSCVGPLRVISNPALAEQPGVARRPRRLRRPRR